jgi:zinc-ribbon domain
MKCPVCNAELPATAKFCGGCGTTLLAPSAPPPPAPAPSAAPSYEQSYPANPESAYGSSAHGGPAHSGGPMPAVKKKYKVLRLIAVLIKIFAAIAGALLIIGGLVTIVAGAASGSRTTALIPDVGPAGPAAFFGSAVIGLIMLVYGVVVFIFLYAYAEWMYVFMDIEENTRMTNDMLSGRR